MTIEVKIMTVDVDSIGVRGVLVDTITGKKRAETTVYALSRDSMTAARNLAKAHGWVVVSPSF